MTSPLMADTLDTQRLADGASDAWDIVEAEIQRTATLLSAYKNATGNLLQGHPELMDDWRRLCTQYGIPTT